MIYEFSVNKFEFIVLEFIHKVILLKNEKLFNTKAKQSFSVFVNVSSRRRSYYNSRYAIWDLKKRLN